MLHSVHRTIPVRSVRKVTICRDVQELFMPKSWVWVRFAKDVVEFRLGSLLASVEARGIWISVVVFIPLFWAEIIPMYRLLHLFSSCKSLLAPFLTILAHYDGLTWSRRTHFPVTVSRTIPGADVLVHEPPRWELNAIAAARRTRDFALVVCELSKLRRKTIKWTASQCFPKPFTTVLHIFNGHGRIKFAQPDSHRTVHELVDWPIAGIVWHGIIIGPWHNIASDLWIGFSA